MLFPPPEDFGYRIFLVGAAIFNLLLSLFSEMVLSDTLVRKAVNRKDKAYELVNKELNLQPKWPPISPAIDGATESNCDQNISEDSQVMDQIHLLISDVSLNAIFKGDSYGDGPSPVLRASFQQPVRHPELVDPLRGSLVFKPINHATEKASPTPRPRYYNGIH